MIDLNISIYNPFIKQDFNILFYEDKLLPNHKACEIQLSYYPQLIFELVASISARCDHAGATLTIGVLGFSLNMMFYDTRHWDIDNGKWCEYN